MSLRVALDPEATWEASDRLLRRISQNRPCGSIPICQGAAFGFRTSLARTHTGTTCSATIRGAPFATPTRLARTSTMEGTSRDLRAIANCWSCGCGVVLRCSPLAVGVGARPVRPGDGRSCLPLGNAGQPRPDRAQPEQRLFDPEHAAGDRSPARTCRRGHLPCLLRTHLREFVDG